LAFNTTYRAFHYFITRNLSLKTLLQPTSSFFKEKGRITGQRGITGQHPDRTIKAIWLLNIMSKVYVDSNVFIAVINGDFGRSFEFMDYKSQEFFDKVLSCHYEIVMSDVVIKEIKDKTLFNDEELNAFLNPFSHKLTIINVNKLLFEKAKQLNRNMKTGVGDCIHYLISKEYGPIVTWNIRHFPNGKKPSEM
jgi:predicted nucleic acid-binding protein